jgi:hypothetical protein
MGKQTVAQQKWAALQTYFKDKWLECKQYSATTAKQLRFKETVLLAQETAAAEEERELQAMLFAMLQEQHDKHEQGQHGRGDVKDVCACNQDEVVTDAHICPPTDTDRTKKHRKQKALCPHCKTFDLHKPEKFYELEANKEKRWPGWKSVHATA